MRMKVDVHYIRQDNGTARAGTNKSGDTLIQRHCPQRHKSIQEDMVDQRGQRPQEKTRAIEHWLRQNQMNFTKMDECDFTKRAVPESDSPLSYFRAHGRKFEVLRYFVFLFQMVLKLVRVWRPTRKQLKDYGAGVHTAARRALLIHHTGPLPPESSMQFKSFKRYLYCRVAREAENLTMIEETAKAEFSSDAVMGMVYRIMDHIDDVMIPLVKAGTFPRINVEHNALTQYAEVMEDYLEHHLTKFFHMGFVCVLVCDGQRSHVLGGRGSLASVCECVCVCVCVSCACFVFWRVVYREWNAAMDVIRWSNMKNRKFLNLTWQVYVDRVVAESSGELRTTDITVQMSSPSVPQHVGSLANAVRSAMPGLDLSLQPAEEVVDSCLVEEDAAGRIPYQVFSPVHVPEHNTHAMIVIPRVVEVKHQEICL